MNDLLYVCFQFKFEKSIENIILFYNWLQIFKKHKKGWFFQK